MVSCSQVFHIKTRRKVVGKTDRHMKWEVRFRRRLKTNQTGSVTLQMIQSRLINKFYHLRIKEEWRKLEREGGWGEGLVTIFPQKRGGGEVFIREGA